MLNARGKMYKSVDEEPDIRAFILNYQLLTYCGFWVNDFKENWKRWLFVVYRAINMWSLNFFIVLLFVDLYLALNDIHKVAYNLCTTVTVVIIFYKSLNIQRRTHQIEAFRSDLNNNFKLPYIGQSREDVQILNESSKYAMRISKILYFFGVSTVTIWCFIPLIDRKGSRKLPFCTWIPELLWESPYYELVYVWHVVGGSVLMVNLLATDLIYFSTLIQLGAQYSVLEKNILAVGEKFLERRDGRSLRVGTRNNVIHHQSIIRAVLQVEDIYNRAILIHISGATTLLCVVGFDIIMGFQFSTRLLTQLFYVVGDLADIAFYCFCGSHIERKSQRIAAAVFNSPWHYMDSAHRKNLQLIMVRAQNAPIVRAWKTVPVNLPTYLKVLRIAYNGLAIMRQVASR